MISAEVFLTEVGNKDLCGPFFDRNDTLHVCLQNSAEVYKISGSGQLTSVHSTQGQLSGGCIGSDGSMYLADLAHVAILKSSGDDEQGMVVDQYEDRPLKGPNSLIINKNTIYT